MKIAISAQGRELTSPVNPRFGRCEYFVIYDQQTDSVESMSNPGTSGAGGAGIKTAQALANEKVDAVLVGNVGPNAVETLNAAKIEIYSGITGTVQDTLNLFKEGKLVKTNQPSVESHFGLK